MAINIIHSSYYYYGVRYGAISVFILDLLPALKNFAKAVMILIGSPDINQHYFNHDLFYVVYYCVLLSHQIPSEYANHGWLIVV